MPKSKKPAGGRPAKNFEPRYGDKPAYQDRKRHGDGASASKPGSKSPSHRGYRAAESTEAAPKRRWTAQERAGRDESRGIRTQAGGAGRSDDRPRRSFDDRPARSYDDRPARSSERPARSYDDRPARSSDRPSRSFEGRPARSFDDRPRRDDRPVRTDRVDRTERRTTGDARPSYRDDRPRRSFDDRPARSSDRPARSFGDRPARDDRPARSFDDRPRRDDRRSEGPGRSDWSSAPKRSAQQEQHVDVVHERLQADAVDAASVTELGFAELGLGENIVRVLADLGASSPFPIQAATVAPILQGRDVLARGRTGSGKTIAFGAPLVESVLRAGAGTKRAFARAPRALILAPTRELALQIDSTVQPIARSVGLFTTQIYGGVPQGRQVGALRKGVDIVIGTPGRVEDLVEQGKLDLSEVKIVVLDEADHMCELGFLEPVQRILRHTAAGSQ